MLIIVDTMLGSRQRFQWFFLLNIGFFVLVLFGSCGIRDNENKAGVIMDKGKASATENIAFNGETIKDLKAAHIETATFALG